MQEVFHPLEDFNYVSLLHDTVSEYSSAMGVSKFHQLREVTETKQDQQHKQNKIKSCWKFCITGRGFSMYEPKLQFPVECRVGEG